LADIENEMMAGLRVSSTMHAEYSDRRKY